MNFIESLGGYEKAKAKRRDINNTLDSCEFTCSGDAYDGLLDRLESIDKSLLDYRRKNNIFEVGDWVVKTNPKIRYAHVRVVISTSISGGAALDYQGFPYRYPCIRHATDEEIKAGHRL